MSCSPHAAGPESHTPDVPAMTVEETVDASHMGVDDTAGAAGATTPAPAVPTTEDR